MNEQTATQLFSLLLESRQLTRPAMAIFCACTLFFMRLRKSKS